MLPCPRRDPLTLIVLALWISLGSVRSEPLQALAAPFASGRADAADAPSRPSPAPSVAPLALLSAGSGHLVPGAFPSLRPGPGLPKVFAPSQPREPYTRHPWRLDIVATVFWIGELPTRNNPTPNTKSAWDRHWTANYGGYDDPDPKNRDGLLPSKFVPGQNPFYFALPYNDISKTGTKASARAMVPWFDEVFHRDGRTVLKGRWIAVRRGDKVCYAQWEDVGPFETDDWEYVFGGERPKTTKNRGAGLDVSPAVRDYLEFGSGYGVVDWRFVDMDEVPEGPWRDLGANNPFASDVPSPAADAPLDSWFEARAAQERLLERLDAPLKANRPKGAE